MSKGGESTFRAARRRVATSLGSAVDVCHHRRVPAAPQLASLGVNAVGYLRGGLGLGQAARLYVQALHEAGVPVLPHAVANASRVLTGVEIHPAARIGDALFIDHGAGVVIGETAEIGDNVTIYQAVTLGGTGFARGKRHPTVDDDVVIGSGAKLLGPIHVGEAAKVGANSVVIHDVPPRSTVVGNPGHPVRVDGRKPEGPDADWAHLPDPVADAIRSLSDRVAQLEAELGRERGADVRPIRRKGSDPAGG